MDWQSRDDAYDRMLAGMRSIVVLVGAPSCLTQRTRCSAANATPPYDTDQANQAWYEFVGAAAERFSKARGLEIGTSPTCARSGVGATRGSPTKTLI